MIDSLCRIKFVSLASHIGYSIINRRITRKSAKHICPIANFLGRINEQEHAVQTKGCENE